MVKPVSDPTPVGKGAEKDAETDVMGSDLDAESDVSSDAIPDCFFGVVDEPQIESNEEARCKTQSTCSGLSQKFNIRT